MKSYFLNGEYHTVEIFPFCKKSKAEGQGDLAYCTRAFCECRSEPQGEARGIASFNLESSALCWTEPTSGRFASFLI